MAGKFSTDIINVIPSGATGSPTSGTYTKGDIVCDINGSFWKCSASGTPGTWYSFGNFEGPVSSTDNAIPRWSGTGGTGLQDSGIIIDDSNNINGVASLTATGVNSNSLILSSNLTTVTGATWSSNGYEVLVTYTAYNLVNNETIVVSNSSNITVVPNTSYDIVYVNANSFKILVTTGLTGAGTLDYTRNSTTYVTGDAARGEATFATNLSIKGLTINEDRLNSGIRLNAPNQINVGSPPTVTGATFSSDGTTVIITKASHGLNDKQGIIINGSNNTSALAQNAWNSLYQITYVNVNSFSVQYTGTTGTGTCTYVLPAFWVGWSPSSGNTLRSVSRIGYQATGASGTFTIGETAQGLTSNATAKILRVDGYQCYVLLVDIASGSFQLGERVKGLSSNAEATIYDHHVATPFVFTLVSSMSPFFGAGYYEAAIGTPTAGDNLIQVGGTSFTQIATSPTNTGIITMETDYTNKAIHFGNGSDMTVANMRQWNFAGKEDGCLLQVSSPSYNVGIKISEFHGTSTTAQIYLEGNNYNYYMNGYQLINIQSPSASNLNYMQFNGSNINFNYSNRALNFNILKNTSGTALNYNATSDLLTYNSKSTFNDLVTTNAGRIVKVNSLTASGGTTGLTSSDYFICVTGTASHTLTLPNAVNGQMLVLKNRGTGVVTVNIAGSNTIDGLTATTIPAAQSITLIANNTDWTIN